ncbi:DUF262 domain-containing protein [Tenacibaculum dicentrarchi]|nr:DUF262 domain-containing protein [Tenacibaculum dicentrarchi]
MKEIKQELSIRGENIQRVYQFYKNNSFIVNRKYQRKLVWNIEEKKSFIESISRGYPVPLFLLAEVVYDSVESFEIIDGMQRLNAITSFIEQEIDINGEYFDLETMVETKYLLDKKDLNQKTPKISREICTKIASYVLPLSVYKKDKSEEIDEIFRRINSGGRQLSKQDIRQSNSLGKFADVVRKISAKFRGDDSQSDELLLSSMKKISISNRNLNYGINVNDIFWVKESIIAREKVRQSSDEEIIADILGYLLLEKKPTTNSELLDNLYGVYSTSTQQERFERIDNNLKISSTTIIERFIYILDVFKELRMHYGNNTNLKSIMYPNKDAGYSIPKPFQILFIAIYEIIFNENMVVENYQTLLNKVKDLGKHISISSGGNWSGSSRTKNIEDVKALTIGAFRKKTSSDKENPVLDSWSTKLENVLMQSFSEQELYDFKQGFHRLDNVGNFDDDAFSKVIKTLTAMHNTKKNSKGYVIVGVADNDKDSDRIENVYKVNSIEYNKFKITGIDGEVKKYNNEDYEKYYNLLLNKLKTQPIEDEFRNHLSIKLVNYHQKAIIIFEVTSSNKPYSYGESFYVRSGSNIEEVNASQLHILFSRFQNN